MKTRLSLILALIIVLSSFTGVFASNYQDAGELLNEIGVLTGDGEGNLLLDKNLSRQDMVILISRLYNQEDIAKNYQGKNIFKDLDQTRKSYIPYINWARDQGLIYGISSDEFGFNMEISVHELQAVLIRVLGYEANWEDIPKFSKELGLMKGLDLDPASKLTRGEMSQMIVNALDLKIEGSQETLADRLKLNVKEVFRAGFKVNGNQVEFRGRAHRTNNLQIEIRPKDGANEASISDLQLDENSYFGHIIEDLDVGDYQYRLIGDKYRTVFVDFKIEKELFPEDNLEIEDKNTDLLISN